MYHVAIYNVVMYIVCCTSSWHGTSTITEGLAGSLQPVYMYIPYMYMFNVTIIAGYYNIAFLASSGNFAKISTQKFVFFVEFPPKMLKLFSFLLKCYKLNYTK